MKKNNLPAAFLPSSSSSTARHPALSPAPCILPVLLQLKHLQHFPASASVPGGVTALTQLVAPVGHVPCPPQRWVLGWPAPGPSKFQGLSQEAQTQRCFLGLPEHSPAAALRAVNADLALPHHSAGNHLRCPTRWWGVGTDIYHQPFKAKKKISPSAPSTAPWGSQDTQGQGRKREQITAQLSQVLSPCLALGTAGFPNFMSLSQCPWTGWSHLCSCTKQLEALNFRNSLNSVNPWAILAGMIWAMRALQIQTSSIYIRINCIRS